MNYNAGLLLASCVKNALEQSDQVVVVDNDSCDGSLKYLEDTIADRHDLTIIRNRLNLGFASACNIGSQYAKNELILFLNPDCILGRNAVFELVAAMNENYMAGIAGPYLANSDGTEQEGGRRALPTPWRAFVRAFGLYRLARWWPDLFSDFHLHTQPVPDRPVEVEAISGACLVIKKELLFRIGLWDERYFLHCEDLDLCMRVRQGGNLVLFVPTARSVHHHRECSRTRPIFVEWHKHKGMVRFYKKFFRSFYPKPFWWLVVSGIWFRFSVLFLYLIIRKFIGVFRLHV